MTAQQEPGDNSPRASAAAAPVDIEARAETPPPLAAAEGASPAVGGPVPPAVTQATAALLQAMVAGLIALVWERDAPAGQMRFINERAEDPLGYPLSQWMADPTCGFGSCIRRTGPRRCRR